jgi:UDP-N-acetylmuramate dehydrogenase
MELQEMELQENVPLAPLTTLGVGGNARFFVTARSAPDVEEAIALATAQKLPLFVLGGGSNLVISDRGWHGLVLRIAIPGIRDLGENGLVEAGAGVEWDAFVVHCVSRNYAGVECLSGIPGSIGGTPVQNVGAYGQEACDTIASVLAFDRTANSVRELSAAECKFSYRRSIFNSTQRGQFIILRVTYALVPGGSPSLLYADLKKYFAASAPAPTLSQTRDAVREIRGSKSMLISPGDRDSRSAGSFFKNPLLSPSQHEDLSRRASERNLKVPTYPALAQQQKVSAAWLVENAGFSKGYARGPAAISSKHALALVNRGGATAKDIIALKDEIQAGVEQVWGIQLEAEPEFVGF